MDIDRNFLKKATVFLIVSITMFLFLAMPSFAAQTAISSDTDEEDTQPVSSVTADTKAAEAVPLNTKSSTAKVSAAQTAEEDNDEYYAVSPGDPYEKFNRVMFSFNENLDKYVLKPVATVYNLIMPRPLNEGVHNVFVNIDTLPTIANDILQLHFYQAANDMWRFGVNTTIGIGGLFDVASRIKLMPYKNDFGMTLARYGYAKSTFVMLPFWGPRTIRDTVSLPVDYYAFSIYPYIQPESLQYGVYGLSVIDWRAQVLKHQDLFDVAAVDKYAFVRNAYIQYRSAAVKNNEHRTYEDLKEETPVAIVDSSKIQASDNEPTLDYAT